MPNRNVPLLRLLLAFLIATFLLITGFLIGHGVSSYKYQHIALQQENIRYDLLSLDLQGQMVDSCNPVVLSSISSELDQMGSYISILEEQFGKTDKRVLDQKSKYTLLEVQHFLNIKKYNEECDGGLDTILFFYSNSENLKDDAEGIGFILGNVKSKNPEKIMIYSFDFDLQISMIKVLREIYGVTSANTLVVNEKDIVFNLNSAEELNRYLESV